MNADPELVLEGGTPAEAQIRRQIRRLIASGVLLPGEELPSVRSMAVGLCVSPHAVESAYACLSRQGWLEADDGFRVAGPPRGGRQARLRRLCTEFLDRARLLGLSPAQAIGSVETFVRGNQP